MIQLISFFVDRLATAIVKKFKTFIGSFKIEVTVTTTA
jgi:hypothetical protein